MRDALAAWRRTAVATLLICAVGGTLLARGTDGFRALTSEQARRNAIARAPRDVPDVALEDQDGRAFRLADYRGQPLAVDFVYTQCRTLCPLSSAGFQQLARDGDSRLQLVTISFDPRDTPPRLRAYAALHHADARAWRFARVAHSGDLAPLLRAFGIVVIPAAGGDFQHNAAVHVIDVEGRLARVLDAGAASDEVTRAVVSIAAARGR